MKQIPNILTSLRIVLAGVFAWQFFVQLGISQDPSNSIGVHAFWIPIAIYAVAFLTDILDGFLARTFHWITPVGKILDPVADKLMAITALVCILLGKHILKLNELWYTILFVMILVKEAAMVIAGGWMLAHHKVAYADWFGKSATGVLTAGMILSILSFALPVIEPWNLIVLGIAVVMSYVSAIHYARTQLFAKQTDRPLTEDEKALFARVDRILHRDSAQKRVNS